MSIQPVSISYASLLKDDLSSLHDDILKAFGSSDESLGLIILRDLPPQFAQLREDAMRSAARFASLPESTREKYTDPASSYSFGWSHGKEVMNGRPDIYKGSYYANPVSDDSGASEDQRKEHPSYLRSNVWPSSEDCPGFEQAFKALASFMTETGKKLARACDNLVAAHSNVKSVEALITDSQCSKARLLHYFPPEKQIVRLAEDSLAQTDAKTTNDDAWCGTHLDHSLLTALCPAMYLFHPSGHPQLSPVEVPAPTATAGLYIQTRAGKTVKASIPPGCLAFQTGEALQLLTKGTLRATPHWVSPGAEGAITSAVTERLHIKVGEDSKWSDVTEGVVSRETMAVFLQPDVSALIGEDGETFGQFTHRIISSHYESAQG